MSRSFILFIVLPDQETIQKTCASGVVFGMAGDGYCHDETNNEECKYDGGDCCGYCVNKYKCSDCKCRGGIISNPVPNALVGDGFCHDETNNAECYFDGLDCCGPSVNTTLCSECTCHGEFKGFLGVGKKS